MAIIGDGITDLTEPIQAYINGHPTATFADGVYLYTTLTIPTGHTVRGSGPKTEFRQINSASGIVIDGQQDIGLENLLLAGTSTATDSGLLIRNSTMIHLRDVWLRGNAPSAGQGWNVAAIQLVAADGGNLFGLSFDNVCVTGAYGDAIYIPNGIGPSRLVGGRLHANGGVGIHAPGGICLWSTRDAIIEGNAGGAIDIANLLNSQIVGCAFENPAGSTATLIKLGVGGACKGVDLRACSLSGGAADYLIELSGLGANFGVDISSNRFLHAAVAAIRLAKVWYSRIWGNEVQYCPALYAFMPGELTQCKVLLLQDGVNVTLFSTGIQADPVWTVGHV